MPTRPYVSGIIIDCAGTTDPDDAVGLKSTCDGFIVTVSITDITRSVMPRGKVFRTAVRRARTYYDTPMGNIHMLPEQLATSQLCLAKGKKRRVVAAQFMFNPEFQLRFSCLTLGNLRAKQQMTYDQAGLALNDSSHPQHQELSLLSSAAQALFNVRSGLPPARWIPDEGQLDQYLEEKGLLHHELRPSRMIEELMVASNLLLARTCHELQLPIVYRVHTAMYPNSRAYYSTRPGPHHALGAPLYAHGTSPLRRLPDFLNQLQAVRRLEGRKILFTLPQLRNLIRFT